MEEVIEGKKASVVRLKEEYHKARPYVIWVEASQGAMVADMLCSVEHNRKY